MAGNGDIIKEYLVALGFKVDQSSYNKFDAALSKSGKAAFAFAGAVAAMAAGTVAFVDQVAHKLDDLYWSSVRLNEGSADIQDYALQISKLGGTAEGAISSMENLSEALKTDPSAEATLNGFGVSTRDAVGNLRQASDIIKDIARIPQPLMLRKQIAGQFGVDYSTLMGSIRAETLKTEDTVKGMWARVGINADVATAASHNFSNELADQKARWGVIADVIGYRLIPVAEAILGIATAMANDFLALDRATGGLSTKLIALATAILAVNAAMKVTTGLGLIGMLESLGPLLVTIGTAIKGFSLVTWLTDFALEAAVITETVLPGLAAGFLSLGIAIEATPLGWLLTIIALVAGAVYMLVKHWDILEDAFSKGTLADIAEDFGDIWHMVQGVFGALGDLIGALWDIGGNKVFLTFLFVVRDVLRAITESLATVTDLLTGNFSRALQHAGKLWGALNNDDAAEVNQYLADQPKRDQERAQREAAKAAQASPDYRAQEAGLDPFSLYGAENGSDGARGPTGQPGQGGATGAPGAKGQPGNPVIDRYGDTRPAGAGADVTGKALAFFEKVGWTASQAAGIVANLVNESQLNTKAVGDQGQAVGVAQWHPDRQADFKKWSGGQDVRDAPLEKQLEFLQYEMTQGSRATRGFVESMKAAANSAAMAAVVVSKYVEAPDDKTGSKANQRATTAVQLMAGAKAAPSGNKAATNVKIDQKTDIKIQGSGDPDATARATGREIKRVNGDIVRNFAGAAQ